MSIKERLSHYIEGKKKQIQRGIEISEQMKAEKERQKILNGRGCVPGTFRYGLKNMQNPLDFMSDVYERRKAKR